MGVQDEGKYTCSNNLYSVNIASYAEDTSPHKCTNNLYSVNIASYADDTSPYKCTNNLYSVNIASYADDTSPYTCSNNLYSVTAKLENNIALLIRWINKSNMKANPDKRHILLSENEFYHTQ